MIRWNSTIGLFKLESGGYGVDPVPTGINGILMTEVVLTPLEADRVSRNLERPFIGGQSRLTAARRSVLRFRVELQASGTAGTAPAWGPLVRVCRHQQALVALTSATYTRISDALESGTFYLWKGNTRHVMTGIRGTVDYMVNAQGIPYLLFTLTGLYNDPSEETRVTPTLTGFIKPLVVTNANTPIFTVDGVSLVMKTFSLRGGDVVQHRLRVGHEEIVIMDGEESGTVRVDAVPLSTFNPFEHDEDDDPVAVVLRHGTVAGSIVTLNAPTSEVEAPAYQNDEGVFAWDLTIRPLPSATGNDQLSLVCT